MLDKCEQCCWVGEEEKGFESSPISSGNVVNTQRQYPEFIEMFYV